MEENIPEGPGGWSMLVPLGRNVLPQLPTGHAGENSLLPGVPCCTAGTKSISVTAVAPHLIAMCNLLLLLLLLNR